MVPPPPSVRAKVASKPEPCDVAGTFSLFLCSFFRSSPCLSGEGDVRTLRGRMLIEEEAQGGHYWPSSSDEWAWVFLIAVLFVLSAICTCSPNSWRLTIFGYDIIGIDATPSGETQDASNHPTTTGQAPPAAPSSSWGTFSALIRSFSLS